MTNMEIAQTILDQMGGNGRLSAMIAIHNVIVHENGVSFKFKGSKKANYIKIILDPLDTYTVQFMKIRGMNFKVIKELEFVYCDMLKEIFETTTGLYLSL